MLGLSNAYCTFVNKPQTSLLRCLLSARNTYTGRRLEGSSNVIMWLDSSSHVIGKIEKLENPFEKPLKFEFFLKLFLCLLKLQEILCYTTAE